MIARRGVLLGATALAGCGVAPPTAAAWASDAQALATGLGNLVPQAAAIAGVPGSVAGLVTSALAAAADLAKQLASTASQSAGQPVLQQIEGYVNAALSSLQPYYALLPAPFGTALTAVNLLLPFVEAALGMIVAAVGAAPARAPMLVRAPAPSAPPASMTPQQAHDWAVGVLTR